MSSSCEEELSLSIHKGGRSLQLLLSLTVCTDKEVRDTTVDEGDNLFAFRGTVDECYVKCCETAGCKGFDRGLTGVCNGKATLSTDPAAVVEQVFFTNHYDLQGGAGVVSPPDVSPSASPAAASPAASTPGQPSPSSSPGPGECPYC